MAQPLELTEYQQCVWDAPLDHGQLQALAAAHISVSPSVDREDAHLLRPSSWVGAVNIGDRSVIVRPKIPVDRAMFLMTYALDPKHWRNEAIDLAPDADVLEAVALAFARRTQQAIHRGLLRGYRREEDALNTVRGQIRFADQVGRRYGLPLPIEVAYDEYTEDIEQNRLLKAAIHRLAHTQIRSVATRQVVRRLRPAFDLVQLGSYAPGAVPEIRYTRLDEHYRPAVELARLIIENSSLELFDGKVAGGSFLIDMNRGLRAVSCTLPWVKPSASTGTSGATRPASSWMNAGPSAWSPISPGGLPARTGASLIRVSSATPSTRSSNCRVSGTLTSTRCWPTVPQLTCPRDC